ncbi:hypothetical protein [Pseudomonas sp. S60]|uniref:hypothetical protein n=1 Tax=Pseudomonas sp. S60 TaxID=211124 RepID=UPI00191149BB
MSDVIYLEAPLIMLSAHSQPARTNCKEDPATRAFLGLLEADIRRGLNLSVLRNDLAQGMLANAGHAVNLEVEIDGEVSL